MPMKGHNQENCTVSEQPDIEGLSSVSQAFDQMCIGSSDMSSMSVFSWLATSFVLTYVANHSRVRGTDFSLETKVRHWFIDFDVEE